MDFTERAEANYMVLEPSGKLNLVAAGPLKARIADLARSGKSRIVVDMSGVDFIDSSGLGALVTGHKVAREAGGDLRVANVGEQVAAVMKLTNLDRLFVPHASVKAAADGWH